MALKLYTFPGNKNAYKALIAAEFVGVKIDVLPFEWGKTNKSEEFLKLTPIGKVPVLQTPNGSIFESNAIARYVARLADKGLFGTTLLDMAQVEQWIDFSSNELDLNLSRWGGPLFGYGQRIKEVEEASITAAKRGLQALDDYLTHNTYLVGHHITLADIITVCGMLNAFKNLLSEDFMKAYPHVQRYFFTLVNHPKFKSVVGEVKQPAAVPTEVQPRPAAPAAAKPAAEEKKEAAPAPATPSAGQDEEEAAPKPKAKNPLDLLPPSPMIMDAWKRLYSNTKAHNFREVAIKGFWDMYDPEGYSLWFATYKYNDENTVPFVTMNKVSGWFQRMDVVRKYAFAKMCILGDKPPYVVKGFWLFRGQEVPAIALEECYDMELFEWTKVDINDEAQKEFVNVCMEEPDVIDNLPLLEAKCFK